MARPSQYPLELRKRAVRMVAEVRPEYDTEWSAMKAVASKLGIGTTETLRKWVRQDQIDAGSRPGTTTEESAQIKAMKKEIAELKRANEILKAAASFFASFTLAEHLEKAGIAASIRSVGDAYDNALMESTIGLFKTEAIKPQRPWRSLAQVELATAEWTDWYNHTRLHGEMGHIPPAEYEANHYTKHQVTTNI